MQRALILRFFRYDHLPGISRKSQDDQARKGKYELFIETYISLLITALKYNRICPSDSFSKCKTVLLTGLAIIDMLIFVDLLSEIAIWYLETDAFIDAIGVATTHLVGLLKWSYCTIRNKKLFDVLANLEKCHLLCQRIDTTKEGMYKLFTFQFVNYICIYN